MGVHVCVYTKSLKIILLPIKQRFENSKEKPNIN